MQQSYICWFLPFAGPGGAGAVARGAGPGTGQSGAGAGTHQRHRDHRQCALAAPALCMTDQFVWQWREQIELEIQQRRLICQVKALLERNRMCVLHFFGTGVLVPDQVCWMHLVCRRCQLHTSSAVLARSGAPSHPSQRARQRAGELPSGVRSARGG